MLPPERELAEQFQVSRMTLRQALRSLTEDGLIYAIRGVGTFVAEPRVSKDISLTSFSEDMRARGFRPSTKVLDAQEEPAELSIAQDLGIEPGTTVIAVERIRFADDAPVCHETVRVPARFFPNLLDQDLSGSLYDLFETRYRIRVERARQTTRAINLSRHLADLLGVGPRAAALHVLRIGQDARGRLVERTESVYRGDRYDFSATITRSKRPRG